MPLATTDEYAAMLDAAAAERFAYPAINVTSSSTLSAALRGFAEAGSDGIVQVTVGGAGAISGSAVGDPLMGYRALAAFAHVVAESSPVLVALHTDHCPPGRVDDVLRPLIAESRGRVDRGGAPLYHSHMFDGSSLPLDENLAIAAGLLRDCAAAGLVLEVECGVVGGEEDGISGGPSDRPERYTTVPDLLRVAEALGTGERGGYLLAATFGNVHGVNAGRPPELRPGILRDGQAALAARTPGARFRYVFHGTSGTPDPTVREAVEAGVVKVNVDTDAQYAYTRAVAGHMLDHWQGVIRVDGGVPDKHSFDPRAWGAVAEAGMATLVRDACELTGSAGRTVAARHGSG